MINQKKQKKTKHKKQSQFKVNGFDSIMKAVLEVKPKVKKKK